MKHVMAKGTYYVLLSQIFFMMSSYLFHFGLGRYLGPADYGVVGIILSLLALIQLFLLHGLHEIVVKYIAENKQAAKSIYNNAQFIQLVFSLMLAGIYYLCAPLVANLLNDISLLPYIKISALILPAISLYSISMAYLEGLKRFKAASAVKLVYGWSKLLFVGIFLFMGYRLGAIIFSFFLAALVAYLVFNIYIKNEKVDLPFEDRKGMMKLAIPIVVFYVGIIIVINMDILFIKALIPMKELVGYYTSSMTVSRVPYLFFITMTTTLLPFVSKANADNNLPQVRNYVRKSLRYLLILLIPSIFIISLFSKSIIQIAYGSAYLPAGEVLSIMIWGYCFIILFSILSTIFVAVNKIRVIVYVTLVMVVSEFFLNLYLVPMMGLQGGAIALTVSTFIGFLIIFILSSIEFKKIVRLSTTIKIAIACLIMYFFSKFLLFSGIYAIISIIMLYFIFFSILFVLKELNKRDIAMVKKLILKS
jgi:stage V sporulation protein B